MKVVNLLVVGSFSNDAQRVLAAIQELTGVIAECVLDGLLRIAPELRVAAFTDPNHGLRLLDNAELAFRHASSLPLEAL